MDLIISRPLRNSLFTFLLVLTGTTGLAQTALEQTIAGEVTDQLTGAPLAGATIMLEGSQDKAGTVTDAAGTFAMQVLPGRYWLTVSYVGYQVHTQEVVVIAAKQMKLAITLTEQARTLDSIQVTATRLAMPAGVEVTVEQAIRMPANFFDPVRMLTSYPGVMTANDQNNTIIVRGNSPTGLLWRLNGLDIVNPNHLANAGTLSDKPVANGGGVNIMSAQVLANTRFYAGTLPAMYGNLLAGAIDMRLRTGNATRHEFTTQASLLGLDLSAEGPLSSAHKSSYLINYRYSTIGLLSQLGVKLGDEDIRFHDLSFQLNFPTASGQLAVFGFAGSSRNVFDAKDSVDRKEDKDWQDITYASTTYGVGVTQTQHIRGQRTLAYGIGFSSSEQARDSYWNRTYVRYHKDDYASRRQLTSAFIRFTGRMKLGEASMGIQATYQTDTLYDRSTPLRLLYEPCPACDTYDTQQGQRSLTILQPYWNWKLDVSSVITADIGFRIAYYSSTHDVLPEPRVSLRYAGAHTQWELAYGMNSQVQPAAIHFGLNRRLSPTRMHRASLAVNRTIGLPWRVRGELYYQYVFDIPLNANGTFSAFNYLDGLVPPNLINRGAAANYGIEVQAERKFVGNYYLLTGFNLYQSTFDDGAGHWYSSRFNGRYTTSFTGGREWSRPGKNRTFNINTRLLYWGGLRERSMDVAASAVNYETVYQSTPGYGVKLHDYVRLDLRLSWSRNKPRYTRTLSLDIQNVLGIENQASHSYSFTQGKIVTNKQLGLIPILVYRIDF